MKIPSYNKIPLYVKLIAALILGALVGHFGGRYALLLKPIGAVVLQVLRLLATPLIFVAVVRSLVKSTVSGKSGLKLFSILITNTLVAVVIGLLVVNVIRPGHFVHLSAPNAPISSQPFDFFGVLIGKIPANLVDPFQQNDIISVIIVAVAAGLSLRVVRLKQKEEEVDDYRVIDSLIDSAFQGVLVILHWIFELVPLAVFAVVAGVIRTSGVAPLLSLGAFTLAVILAMLLQVGFYLTRLRLGSWVTPARFFTGGRSALTMAFSTASSAATLPVTYAAVRDRIGVREESASLGVMVGGTFNHDGAALYEAMAALFVSQAIGIHFTFAQQTLVVFMAILASLGAAGIPGAGLVTLFAVFSAVHLPTEYVALLLPLDWFLDRCRTTLNVMGDMVVTCLLDGKVLAAGLPSHQADDFAQSLGQRKQIGD